MRSPSAPRFCIARWWLSGLLLAAGGLGACSGAHEPTQQPEKPVPPQVHAATNVPAMLGESIDGLRRRLRAEVALPRAYEYGNAYACLDPLPTDSVQTFRTGGLLLVACYDVRTRRVHDLLLLGRHEDSLMHQAALRANAPNYLVLPVFRANRSGALLGLRVVDTNRD